MPTKCKAYVIAKANAKWQLQDIELDDPLDHEVLVKIKYAGICHTEFVLFFAVSCKAILTRSAVCSISTAAGLFGEPFPLTVGHEVCELLYRHEHI